MRTFVAAALLALVAASIPAYADGPIFPPPPQANGDCGGGNSVIGYLTVGGALHCGTALSSGSIGTSSIGQLGHFTGTTTVSGFAPGGDLTFADPNFTINAGAVTSGKLATSLAFSGAPTAPTPSTADNSTKLATTAYVQAQGYLLGNQTITVSGDISGSGTTSIPGTVTGLQGRGVASTAPTLNQVLSWNGSLWAPAAAPSGGLNQLTSDVTAGPGTGSQVATVVGLRGRAIASATPTANNPLQWSGTQWAPGAATGASAGTYTCPTITVDASGYITAIVSGSCSGGTPTLTADDGSTVLTADDGSTPLTAL